jgi:hypothetical protein
VLHDDIRSGVPDFRKPLAQIPAMEWSDPEVQKWFDYYGDDGRWASGEGGLPGGSDIADEAMDAAKAASPFEI